MAVILKKVKASSLVESVIAMVLILTITVIGTVILSNVLIGNNNSQRLKAVLLVNEVILKTKEDKTFIDATIKTEENIIIEKTLSKYDKHPELTLLTVSAHSESKKNIYSRRELITTNED